MNGITNISKEYFCVSISKLKAISKITCLKKKYHLPMILPLFRTSIIQCLLICARINNNTVMNFQQGWRVPYYVSGMIGMIVAALAITTMTEPKRTAISEEADADANEVSKPNSVQNTTTPTESAEKTSIWKVLFQPKILILCIAASIRHTGTYNIINDAGCHLVYFFFYKY